MYTLRVDYCAVRPSRPEFLQNAQRRLLPLCRRRRLITIFGRLSRPDTDGTIPLVNIAVR
jgi:hypothetical protein